ncbi:MAG: ion transporter [Anaerotignum sp.]|nr:ion transporter [Anaerotignum sp.]MBR5794473.1 ion transporter [Anaerotignum sp.]
MRRRIYQIIEIGSADDRLSRIYDRFMLICILCSVIPLCFKETNNILWWMDKITVCVFIVDYILRFITADYKLKGRGMDPFLKYPFTFFAIVDLVTILSSLTILESSLRSFRILRLPKCMKTLRFLRYSQGFHLMSRVFHKKKDDLLTVCYLAVGYIIVSAMILFQVEPETFQNFFDAVYWATITLMTVGYGDFYPVTTIGKAVAMISSFLGVAVFALPTGIITAGYLSELDHKKNK